MWLREGGFGDAGEVFGGQSDRPLVGWQRFLCLMCCVGSRERKRAGGDLRVAFFLSLFLCSVVGGDGERESVEDHGAHTATATEGNRKCPEKKRFHEEAHVASFFPQEYFLRGSALRSLSRFGDFRLAVTTSQFMWSEFCILRLMYLHTSFFFNSCKAESVAFHSCSFARIFYQRLCGGNFDLK